MKHKDFSATDYKIDLVNLTEDTNKSNFEPFKFKDLGYLVLYWAKKNSKLFHYHGFVTPEYIKELLGAEQWRKFCNGKREFVVANRIDGNKATINQ